LTGLANRKADDLGHKGFGEPGGDMRSRYSNAEFVALAQYFRARPRMSAVTEGLDSDDRCREDARFYALRRWHKTYVALGFLKLALGLASPGLWA
jgi:hypothetical protein